MDIEELKALIKFEREATLIISNKDIIAGLTQRLKDVEGHIDLLIGLMEKQ